MAKKYENMTTEERIAYHARQREKDRSARAVKIISYPMHNVCRLLTSINY